MCSLIGGRVDQNFKDNIETYMKRLSHRGENQGCGYIVENSEGIFVFRSMSMTTTINNIKKIEDGAFVVIHQRKASVGTVVLENTHPVASNNEKVRVIHNGTRKVFNEFFNASSDSQGLASFLEILPYTEHKQIMKELGVVFYTYKGEGLSFYKDELRPLVRYKDSELFASEPLFSGKWANIKDQNIPIKVSSVSDMEVDEYRDVEYPDIVTSYYCQVCKKVHLRAKSLICGVCETQGKKKPTIVTTPTIAGKNTLYTTKNGKEFWIKPDVKYKVTKECLSNPNSPFLTKDKEYDAHIKYDRKITKHVTCLFINVETGGRNAVLEVDVDKFSKLNKLGKYEEISKNSYLIRFKCANCSKVDVVAGKYRYCIDCKSYKMCHK